jgi:hypothetical protein
VSYIPLSQIFDYTQVNGERQLRLMRLSSPSLPTIPVEKDGHTYYFTLLKGNLIQRITPGMTPKEAGELCGLLHGALTGGGDSPVYTPEQHRARYHALKPTEAQRERIFEAINSVPDAHRKETSWLIASELADWCCDPTNLHDFEITVAFNFAIDYVRMIGKEPVSKGRTRPITSRIACRAPQAMGMALGARNA